jgi:hypothetical protein
MVTLTIETPRQAPSSVAQATERVLRIEQLERKAAFVARALNAVARLADEIDADSLSNIAGGRSDYEVLMRALARPEVLEVLRADDPLAPAMARGLSMRQRLLDAEGGTLSAEQVAALLRISRQAVDKRRRAGKLIGVSLGRRGYAYPAWQFELERGMLPGIEPVLDVLREHDPWMQVAFMVNGNIWLDDQTPLSMLRSGNVEAVIQAAEAYGEHGAP